MPSRKLIRDELRYKTVLCDKYTATGSCPYKHKCQFAHGIEELRKRVVPPLAAAPEALVGRTPPLPGPPPMNVCSDVFQGTPENKSVSAPAVVALPPLPTTPSAAPVGTPPLLAVVTPQVPPLSPLLTSPFNVFSAKADDTIYLRCNEKTGRVEAQRPSTEVLHAVMEPPLRRDLSHHTAMLRRTLSMVLDDASEDVSAPLTEPPTFWLASSTHAYRPAASAA